MTAANLADRIPPQSIEMEQATLGAMLIEMEAIDRAQEIVRPEDFYRDAHRELFAAMEALRARSEPVDLLTLHDCLRDAGTLESVGGMPYLVQLTESVPTATNIESYARAVAEKAQLRRLIAAGVHLQEIAHSDADDLAAVMDEAERTVLALMERRQDRRSTVGLRGALLELIQAIETRQEQGGAMRGIGTGFRDLDWMMGGWLPKNLYLLAARPSMGKTSLSLQFARIAAQTGGVLVASLEMAHEQVTERVASMESMVDARLMQRGDMSADDWRKLHAAADRLHMLPIEIDDAAGVPVAHIRSAARRMKARSGLVFVVVDHIGLVVPKQQAEKHYLAIGEITRTLRELAKELEVPVLALCQLSREVEKRGDKRPMLSDLRDSGNLEEHADTVIFLYRQEYYDARAQTRQEKAATAEIIIAKQRHGGPTGTVSAWFVPEHTRFYPETDR